MGGVRGVEEGRREGKEGGREWGELRKGGGKEGDI